MHPSPLVPPSPAPAPAPAGGLGAHLVAVSREDAVRARFVGAVLGHVPLDRVVELHLFAPMRQGGIESGVAVLAARIADGPPSGTATRLTVYTASYRLTVRGPDRGRWQVDVREEADAPLVTVDAVVRGVQRRAGDASAATRFDAAEVARLATGGGMSGAPAEPTRPAA